MDVRILGPLEVDGEAGPIALPRGRGRALLALLVLRAGEVVATERLIDELWGQRPPATADKSLRNLVSNLRTRLSGDDGRRHSVLATVGPGYVLQISPEQVDAHRFRQLVEGASDAPAAQRAAQLRGALELWRGPALAEFLYEPFAQQDIAALTELRLVAIEERVDADLALGRHATVVSELEWLVAEHPFRERLRGLLMLALYRCGRQADALEVYQVGRKALVEELGIEPGPVLADLEQAILNQDPCLEPEEAPLVDAGTVDTRFGAEAWLEAERKTVTVCYVELAESSTADDADPELLRSLLAQGAKAAREALQRHGGTVEGFIGGVIVAVFGIPVAHEDDALRAVRAAVEVCEAVAALSAALEADRGVRMTARAGISTGEVIVSDPAGGPAAPAGDAVKLAARLQQAAVDGEVLIGETTRQLLDDCARVESVATLVLDRRGRPATVWRLVGLDPADARGVRLGSPGQSTGAPDRSPPLVGRRGEVAQLHTAFQRTLRQRSASRFTVIGEAGVGKSRLALEFAETLPSYAEALWCRCPAYGADVTFWPLRELVAQATGGRGPDAVAALLSEEDDAAVVAAEVAAAIGLRAEPRAGRDVFPAVRRLLETLARRRPVALIVDDAHWAQPTFLELIDYLVESVPAPLLILCLGRSELIEQRQDWFAEAGRVSGSGAPGGSLRLEPLAPEDSERLVVDRLAGRLVPDEVVWQVVEMAQGNPLFIEQLLAALRDAGKLHVPPTLHALLAARLDRLGPAERDLLRSAAVVGVEFSLEAVVALIPDRVGRFLRRHLDALRGKELIRPSHRRFFDGETFAFRHVLIQQAAYRSTSLQVRAELHERLAGWLERQAAPEREEVVGYHLEQAHRHRRLLGMDDEPTHDLALRAGEWSAQAGLRAYERFDMTAAESLLARARALLPGDHPQRYEVLRRLAQAYPTLGRLADAETVLDEMLVEPRVCEDARLVQRLRLEQLKVRLIAGPDPMSHDDIRAEVARVLALLEPLHDDVGKSQACYLLATMHLREGAIPELEEVGRVGLEHARRSGDLREQLGALWWPSWALVAGPTPVLDAIGSCERLASVRHGRHIGVLTDLARLKAMRGQFGEARELLLGARREVQERIRVRRAMTVVAHRAAEVEILAGDLEAAEQTLRPAVEIALDVGERDQTAQIAAELSRVLSTRGATREAATFASLGRQQAPSESVAAQALWRTATARTLALDGDSGHAARLAREAIALVPSAMLNLRAQLHVELAQSLRGAAQLEAAFAAVREAAGLYERKGNLAGARQAHALQEQLGAGGARQPGDDP